MKSKRKACCCCTARRRQRPDDRKARRRPQEVWRPFLELPALLQHGADELASGLDELPRELTEESEAARVRASRSLLRVSVHASRREGRTPVSLHAYCKQLMSYLRCSPLLGLLVACLGMLPRNLIDAPNDRCDTAHWRCGPVVDGLQAVQFV